MTYTYIYTGANGDTHRDGIKTGLAQQPRPEQGQGQGQGQYEVRLASPHKKKTLACILAP